MCRVRYFLILLATVLFAACSADFNEFGKSDYKTLNDLAFKYQTSSIQIYETEHLLVASFSPKDSGSYDSLTFETIDISSLSDLFLVKSKVASVPSDSAEWEELAEDVILGDKPLEEGARIRLPSSREIYLAVVSESGKRCVWRLQVKIEGEVLSSSSASDDPQSSSSSEGNVSASSSSAEALNANTDLQIKLKGEVLDSIIPGSSADTLFVLMPLATDIASSELDTAIYSLSSRVSPDPKTISDWSKKTAFTVTAEDSSVKKWVVSVSRIKNTSASLYITFEKQFKQTKVDSSGTILVKLPYGSALSSAKVESDSTSFGAGISPSVSSVSDWSSAKTFTVTAEDGTVKKWTVTVEVAAEDETASSDKDLLSISAAGEISDATVNSSKKTVVFHLANKAALANVSIAFSISSTASASPASGSIVDLSSSKSLTITAEDGTNSIWTLSADYAESTSGNILKLVMDPAADSTVIDTSTHTVTLYYPSSEDLSAVYFDVLTLSDGASLSSPTNGYLDLSSGSAEMVVKSESGTSVSWAISTQIA
ncbi:MAG: hypothetical protein M0P13_07225, partial [Fibrobacteraceae bacterium]|nr:hypothetical protein [Fibrobacteraceae bacterium]